MAKDDALKRDEWHEDTATAFKVTLRISRSWKSEKLLKLFLTFKKTDLS